MPITRTPMIDDDGSGQTGTVVNNPWKQEFYDQIDAVLGPASALPAPGAAGNLMTSTGALWASTPPGVWVPVPYNAANFTGVGGGTWTVPAACVMANRYSVTGKILTWRMFLNHYAGAMSLTGTVTGLRIAMPLAGATFADWQTRTIDQYVEGGTGAHGFAYGSTVVTGFEVNRRDAAAFAAPPIYLVFNLALEIN